MIFVACCNCDHYEEKSELVTNDTRNVSGELAKYRVWNKHRCKLKQEDKYPKHCDFKPNSRTLIRQKKFKKEMELLKVL